MSRRDTLTHDLFAVPQAAAPLPGSMDFRATLSHLVGEMFRTAGIDRHSIAADASRLTGHNVSKYMLDAYAAESREEFNLPLWVLPAIETACGSHDLTKWLAGVRGGRLLVGAEALAAELGRIGRQKQELADQERAIKEQMRRSR
ncbi:hypothetical protein [Tahibacter soli]|uniref:Uncharacterized protein n=1 Tax=Tahibacter soli TaxID=2983605 RepID=A0A9X3YJG4_9GAMM|nr:hypothetical protein [Tahibacter soli]MDC8012260.1 hypothetical protein [Tahibacter soli]